MKTVDINCRMSSQPGPLKVGIAQMYQAATGNSYQKIRHNGLLLSENHFGLNRSATFINLTQDLKTGLILDLTKLELLEALNIEKAGMTFACKMSLLSKHSDEQMLYNRIAFEESQHFATLNQFIDEDPFHVSNSQFLRKLSSIIEEENEHVLVPFVQIVLEGWGIHHYKKLESHALNQDFARVLSKIIQDEYRHHGMGCLIQEHRDPYLCQPTLDNLKLELLKMVDTSEDHIAKMLHQVSGAPIGKIRRELAIEQTVNRKKQILNSLFLKTGRS